MATTSGFDLWINKHDCRGNDLLCTGEPCYMAEWWCGRVVKAQCLESCGVFSYGFESHRRSHNPTANSALKGISEVTEVTRSDPTEPHQQESCLNAQPAVANKTKATMASCSAYPFYFHIASALSRGNWDCSPPLHFAWEEFCFYCFHQL